MTDWQPRSSGRLTAMRVLAVVMAIGAIGFGVFTAVFGIVNPAQEPHAFHNIVVASLLIVLSAPPVVAVAVAPQICRHSPDRAPHAEPRSSRHRDPADPADAGLGPLL